MIHSCFILSPGYFLLFLLFFSFSPFPFSFSFHPPRLKVVLMVNIQIFTYQFIYIHIYYLYLRVCLFLYKTLGISTMRFRSELEIHWKKKKQKKLFGMQTTFTHPGIHTYAEHQLINSCGSVHCAKDSKCLVSLVKLMKGQELDRNCPWLPPTAALVCWFLFIF